MDHRDSLLHDAGYAYTAHSDGGLEHFRPYAGSDQLANDSAANALHADGYGMLAQPMLHSVPMSTSGKGLGYLSDPAALDLPSSFQAGSGTPISPDSCCGSTSTSPGSASSSFPLSPNAAFSTNGSVASFSSTGSVGCPSLLNYMQSYVPIKYEQTRLIPSFSGMPPPSRSSRESNSVLPLLGSTASESYTSSAPYTSRYAYQTHANPTFLPDSQHSSALLTPRSFDVSINSISSPPNVAYGVQDTPMHYDPSAHLSLNSQNVPPFDKTNVAQAMYNSKGSEVRVDIHPKIDKGFFKADQDWTCYRRNYFSVACHYTLQPPCDPASEPLYLHRSNTSAHERIQSFAVCITARVNGDDGKVIELVQHTPKRDKGPTSAPEKVKLLPHVPGLLGYAESPSSLSPASQLSPDYEGVYPPQREQNPRLANFDRIQFKNATANNGKRRAAQQYFNLVAEMFAQLPSSQSSEGVWVKIATKMSARMVVRGRSPGHYSDDRRNSSTSMGPGGGGSNGDGNGRNRDPNSAGASGCRSGGSGVAFPGSSRAGSGGYLPHQASICHSSSEGSSNYSLASSGYRNGANLVRRHPAEPILTREEASAIEDFEGYQYYPSPLYDIPPHENHAQHRKLPLVNHDTTLKTERHQASSAHRPNFSRVSSPPVIYAPTSAPKSYLKSEPHSGTGGEPTTYQYSMSNQHTGSGSLNGTPPGARSCGRFQGVSTSRGYYPATPAL